MNGIIGPMQYLKLILTTLMVIVISLFLVQNLGQLERPVALTLDLFVTKFKFRPVPIFAILLGGFLFGMVLASLVGLLGRLKIRRRLKDQQRTIATLKKEIGSLRNLPLAETGLEATRTEADGLPPSAEA